MGLRKEWNGTESKQFSRWANNTGVFLLRSIMLLVEGVSAGLSLVTSVLGV